MLDTDPINMKGRHIMVDNETLSLSMNGIILQVGGCEFFPEENRIGSTFNMYVDLRSTMAAGFTLDPDTLLYWWGMDREALERMVIGLKTDPATIAEVLYELRQWAVQENGMKGMGRREKEPDGAWSHGAAFDLAHLGEVHMQMGMKTPWLYRDVFDTRTIFRATSFSLSDETTKALILAQWPEHVKPHVHHDAESDSVYQAIGLMMAMKQLARLS